MNLPQRNQLSLKLTIPKVLVDVDPIKMVWMCYTKQFKKLISDFNHQIKFIYTNTSKMEVSGFRCEEAAKKLKKLVEEQYVVEFLDMTGIMGENDRKAYRPFVEVTMTQEFSDMQDLDRGMCLLTKYKYIEIAKKMAKYYNYIVASETFQNLPPNCVMLYCRQDFRAQFLKIIMENVALIAMALRNNVTPLQAPKFNPKGLHLKRSNFYEFQKQFQVEKIDMIWLSQFDKLQKISKEHQVYLEICDSPDNNQQLIVTINVKFLTIFSQKAKFKQQLFGAFSSIMDQYLKNYMLLRIDIPFSQKQNFHGIVSQEMRKFILDYLKQKFLDSKKRDLEAFRFIDSNVMEDTGMDLDNFYQTSIVQALDQLQQKNKYLYVLGQNDIVNEVNQAAEKYLKEMKLVKNVNLTIIEQQEETYLNNQFDESQILDKQANVQKKHSIENKEVVIKEEQNQKLIQVVEETSYIKLIIYNNPITKVFEKERFNQNFFDDYCQKYFIQFYSKLEVELLQKILQQNYREIEQLPYVRKEVEIMNKQLIITFDYNTEDNQEEKMKPLIGFINQYMNNEFILKVTKVFYQFVQNNDDFLDQKSKENSCNFQLLVSQQFNEILNLNEIGIEDIKYQVIHQKIKLFQVSQFEKQNFNFYFIRVFHIQASYKQNCIKQIRNKEQSILDEQPNNIDNECNRQINQLEIAFPDIDASVISTKKQSSIIFSQNSQIIDLQEYDISYQPEIMHFEDMNKVREAINLINKSPNLQIQLTKDCLMLFGKSEEKIIFQKQLFDTLKNKSFQESINLKQQCNDTVVFSQTASIINNSFDNQLIDSKESQHFYILTESQVQYLEGSVNDLKSLGIQIVEIEAIQRFDIEKSCLVLLKLTEDGMQKLEKQFISQVFRKQREASISRIVLHIKQTFPIQVVEQFSPYDDIMMKSFEKWSQQIQKYFRIYNQKEFKCYFIETNRRRLNDRQIIKQSSLQFKRSDEFMKFIEKEQQFAIKISNQLQMENEDILLAINKVKSLKNIHEYKFASVNQLFPEKGHYLIGICYMNGPKQTLEEFLNDLYMMQYVILFN